VRIIGFGVLLTAITLASVSPGLAATDSQIPESVGNEAIEGQLGALGEDPNREIEEPSGSVTDPNPGSAGPSEKELADRRDPFRPFIQRQVSEEMPEGDEVGVTAFEVRQLKLVGVLLDMIPPRALLQDNSGMGYVVTPGARVGRHGGVVAAIGPGRMTVEEKTLDFYGREQVTRQTLEIQEDLEPQEVGRGKP